MARRRERATIRQEERRLADRALLDAALAPYSRPDHLAEEAADAHDRRPAPLQSLVETVTVHFGGGETIDLRCHPSRAAVVRVRRRPQVPAFG